MDYFIKTNIVPLLENLANALQPFAQGNFVHLRFKSLSKEIVAAHHPESIVPDLTRLVCRIITFTPQEYEVLIQIHTFDPAEDPSFRVSICNSGVDLTSVRKNVLEGIQWNIVVEQREGGGTCFEWTIPLEEQAPGEERKENAVPVGANHPISPFYEKLKQHLTTHFTNIGNLEKAADARSRRDGVFLKKINAVITAHLDQESFDTVSLGKALALSRTQLHRRLKSLIGFAPARYIKYVRLQKAKEFLEREDVTVSEVAFRTGFVNLSHFTRAFREQFGFNPSGLRQDWKRRH